MVKSKERKIGSLLAYGQMFLQIIIGLIYSPIMIRLLGQSEYGLYNTVASTISMLAVLSFGFNSSYIRFYSKYNSKNDQNSINKLNGLFLLIFLLIGLVALLCGLFFTVNIDWIFKNGLTSTEYPTARVLMLLLTVNLAVSFPMSVFSNIISAHEKFVFLKLLNMIKTILTPLLNIPLLLLGYGSIGLVLMSLFLTVVTDTIFIIYVFAILKNRFVFSGFEKGLFKSLFNFTFFIALNMIVDELNTNLDKVLLGRYVGTISVAVYSVGFSLYNYYKLFSTSISGIFTPLIHSIQEKRVSEEDKYVLFTDLFIRVGRIQYLILMLILSGLVLFAPSFIVFWVGPGYENAYWVCILLAIPATIPLIQNMGIEIQRAQSKHQFRSIVYAVMAVINLGLTMFLCQRYGEVGAVIGTAISITLANGIVMNIFYYKVCHINIISFWKNILRISLGLLPAMLIGICLRMFMDLGRIIPFVIDGAIPTVIGMSLAHPQQSHYAVMGDLTFFYSFNVLGNRHVSNNLRIMLINNKCGLEFNMYPHRAYRIYNGDSSKINQYIAAGGHTGTKKNLVKHYAEDLGFTYLAASTKEEYLEKLDTFLQTETDKPILFEVFTDIEVENRALKEIRNIRVDASASIKRVIKKVIGRT